jgi:hypothetical protein
MSHFPRFLFYRIVGCFSVSKKTPQITVLFVLSKQFDQKNVSFPLDFHGKEFKNSPKYFVQTLYAIALTFFCDTSHMASGGI